MRDVVANVATAPTADTRAPVGRVQRLWSRGLVAAVGLLALAPALAGCGAIGGVSAPSTAPTTAPPAFALQQQYVDVVARVSPSVVQIRTSDGLGSGIVFDTDGHIVTNNHVVDGARAFEVVLPDGAQYSARLVGKLPNVDLAVLSIGATAVHPAEFADSDDLAVGDIALAIGNPLGLQSSVTEGIVSALGRTVSEDNNGVTLTDTIQTSAAINPGNSGGALVNLQGQVIGIPTLAATDPPPGGEAPGIGFAISSNTVRAAVTQLLNEQR